MSLPGLPCVTSPGVRNAQVWGRQLQGGLLLSCSSGSRIPNELTLSLPPFRDLLWLSLVLSAAFIIVLHGEEQGKMDLH